MKKLFFLIIILFLLVIASNTNPSEQEYDQWLKDKAMHHVDNKMEKGAISVFGDAVIQKNTVSNDYIFFTLFKTSYQGKQIEVLGAYNHFVPLSMAQ